ncbi:hypothetical protein LG413_14955, partial [Acetobacter persici]|nr:hypothetical protein [Acetobacter persici]
RFDLLLMNSSYLSGRSVSTKPGAIHGDIEAGLLVAPRRFARDGTRYVCLSSANIAQDDRKRAFCTWLAERMNRTLEKFLDRETVSRP